MSIDVIVLGVVDGGGATAAAEECVSNDNLDLGVFLLLLLVLREEDYGLFVCDKVL